MKILSPTAHDTEIIEWVNQLLFEAIDLKASDIHLDPQSDNYRIRIRIDGLLEEKGCLSSSLSIQITARFKIMGQLDIAERRIPQDGSFYFSYKNHRAHCRVSTCPTASGEKTVVRILQNHFFTTQLDLLGLNTQQVDCLLGAICKSHGLILVAGPTGSGKTSTLYSALSILNRPSVNIITVENPIEQNIPGLNQIQVSQKVGMGFSALLKFLLRQDPDILMIGEIRDSETAQLAIQAAQTGHLVLSTLHSNSAISAITRLKQLGIPSLDIAQTVSLVVAQRLARKDRSIGLSGRIGLFETLMVSEAISEAILDNRPDPILLNIANQNGFLSLKNDGLEKVHQQIISASELSRVL